MSKNNKISLSFKLRNNPRISVRSLASEFQTTQGINISRESVRRTMKNMGFSKKTTIKGPGITPPPDPAVIGLRNTRTFIGIK